ncbi:MAG: hypothetical protein AB2L09_02580 [Coriobacteriia bacterium]
MSVRGARRLYTYTAGILLAVLLACCLLLAGCTNGDAKDGEAAASAQKAAPQYAAFIQDDAVNRVKEQITASSSSAGELDFVLEASIGVDDENQQVTIDVVVLTDDVKAACSKAEAVASAFAQYASVTNENGAAVTDPEGLGALWKAYDLVLRADNPNGTLDLDGFKAAGAEKVSWQ